MRNDPLYNVCMCQIFKYMYVLKPARLIYGMLCFR